MPNEHIIQRLSGLQTILNGIHQSGVGLSSATKGVERESFIDDFLSKVLPPVYRFGTGDVTDAHGMKSGQLDVVIEFPSSPSLPAVGSNKSRLYLAEAVAAVVEVKSNLSGQWFEADKTANALSKINRTFTAIMSMGTPPPPQIPLFVVGYVGWKNYEKLDQYLVKSPHIKGALIIDPGIYVSQSGLVATGPEALWALICDLHLETNRLQSAITMPLKYIL